VIARESRQTSAPKRARLGPDRRTGRTHLGATALWRVILVPIDGSDCANAGLREMPRIASQPEHMVLLIHVIEQSGWNEHFYPGTVGEIIQDTLRKEGSFCGTASATAPDLSTRHVLTPSAAKRVIAAAEAEAQAHGWPCVVENPPRPWRTRFITAE
jgi:hypothetical protein